MSGRTLAFIIVGAALCAVIAIVAMRLFGLDGSASVAGGVAGGVVGAVAGSLAAKRT